MFAARALAWAQFSEQSNGAGPPAPAVTVCDFCRHTQGGDDRSHHSVGCKVGAVVAVLDELEKYGPAIRQAVADSMNTEGRIATTPEQPAAAAPGVPAAEGLGGQVIAWPGVPAGGDAAAAREYAAPGHEWKFPPGDFGEPWRVVAGDPDVVLTRDGCEVYYAGATQVPVDDEYRFARRVAACVNLCAYSSTEILERAFEAMAAQFPRWILIAISAEHVTPAKLAELAKHIDTMTAAGGRR
jgi:hypothetical protein